MYQVLGPDLLQNLQLCSYSRGSVLVLLECESISVTPFLKASDPMHMWQLIRANKKKPVFKLLVIFSLIRDGIIILKKILERKECMCYLIYSHFGVESVLGLCVS
jgi:hypothetical protein